MLAHNFLRAGHQDTPLMTWDAAVAGRAQAWADELARTGQFAHSDRDDPRYRDGSGENLYLSSGRGDRNWIARACRSW